MKKYKTAMQSPVCGFKIIGIRILPGCAESIHKVLKPGMTYFLCSGYEEDGDTFIRKVSEENLRIYDVLGKHNTVKVNVSAIVGRNGEGKSTMVEVLIRVLNNFACYLGFKSNQDSLCHIDSLNAILYYEVDDVIYAVKCDGNAGTKQSKVLWYKNQDRIDCLDGEEDLVKLSKLKDSFQEGLFYTTIINYALYAYNSKHFIGESKGDWIDGLFHKNDAYQTPIVINPMRVDGNINVNKEEHLSRQRLMAMFVDAGDERDKRLISDEVEAFGFGFRINKGSKLLDVTLAEYFEDLKDRRLSYEDINGLDDYELSKTMLPGFSEFWTSVSDLLECNQEFVSWLTLYGKNNSTKSHTDLADVVDRIIEADVVDKEWNLDVKRNLSLFAHSGPLRWMNYSHLYRVLFFLTVWDILKEECNELPEILDIYLNDIENVKNKVSLYIPYKVISILTTYAPYYKRKYLTDEDFTSMSDLWPRPSLKKSIHKDVKRILETDDYTTLKLQQSINYLKEQDGGSYGATSIQNLPDGIDSFISFKDLKNKIIYSTTMADIVKYLPPPVFDGDVVLRNKDGHIYLLHTISSGQMQKLNVAGSLIYHLRNLDYRIPKSERIEYSNVNVVFDEVELYFHPDYQRSLLKYLLEQIERAQLDHINNINLIFVTHSPFILTDLTKGNILYLSTNEDEIPQKPTLASNIYDLLDDHFFLEYTIGDVIRKEVDEFIQLCQNRDVPGRLSVFSARERFYSKLIPQIGDDYLRGELDRMYLEMQIESKGRKQAIQDELDKIRAKELALSQMLEKLDHD